MKTMVCSLLAAFAAISGAIAADEEVPAAVRDKASGELAALGRDPIVVAAVRAQNAVGASLESVKAFDQRWISTPGVVDFMKALMESEPGRHLRAWQSARPYVSEVFLMDRLGANVAMTDKTSDYWQGDEKKFTECCRGAGEIFFGPMAFDESTQAYTIQVSVPVVDGDVAIGAICIGIDLEQL